MKTKLKSIGYVFGIVISATALGTLLQFAKAWTEPTAAPPTQNIGAPINTGIIGQGKAGNFSATGIVASTLLVTGDANISGAGNGIIFPDGTKQITATQANAPVPAAGDNLGNHTATQDLNMGGKSITNIGSTGMNFVKIGKAGVFLENNVGADCVGTAIYGNVYVKSYANYTNGSIKARAIGRACDSGWVNSLVASCTSPGFDSSDSNGNITWNPEDTSVTTVSVDGVKGSVSGTLGINNCSGVWK